MTVQIRVGLNSGEVVVRGRSAAICTWTTPRSGRTTHFAARIEQTARPGATRADGPPRLRLAQRVPCGSAHRSAMPVKGVRESVEVV